MSYYVTNENSVLNINNAHLKVSGNIQTDVMKLGAIEFAPPASDVPGTVNFTNVTTGVTTSSNLNVGGTLMLGSVELVTATAALEQTVNLGNVTSNTVQFTNATTSLVASGNVVVTGNVTADHFVGDGSNITGISSTLQAITDSGPGANVTSNTVQFTNATTSLVASGNVGIGTVSPQEKLHVNGNIRLGGPQGTDEDASYYIKSAGQIHINSATDGTADDSYICLDLRAGQSGSNRAGIGICGAATNTSYQKIAFETADQERMSISSQGYLKYNNQPRFSAYSNNGNGTYSGFSSPVVMNSTLYNVGSHYSTSTGAFTAPVTGHYRFSMVVWNNGAVADLSMWYRTSNSGAWDDIAPYKLLGTAPNGDETIWRSELGLGHPTFDLYVPANWQIAFGPRGGGTVTIYRAHTYFSGELISIV